MLKVSTFCSGIGSPEVALKNLGIEHEIILTAEIDKYARQTYLANHSTKKMINDMTVPDYEGEEWYSDINISGLPCQSFSLAGKRLGELDPRGLLFFDFYRYVKNQKPKYFIIENVKGLLSDNEGATFRNWINLLGQSENGNPFFFPHEDSLMYNLHWQVLNTKDYGLPQNRERVFLVGIRNDLPNDFVFPKGVPLTKRLKDVLETNVDEKYYLSDKIIDWITSHREKRGSANKFPLDETDISGCLTARYHKCGAEDIYVQESVSIGAMRGRNPDNPKSRQAGLPTEQMLEINKDGVSNTLTSVQKDNLVIEVKSATKKGFETATIGDSINIEHPNSETRRGRVGKGVAQTLTTSCNQAVIEPQVIGFCRTEEAKKMRKENFMKTGKDTGSFSDRNMVAKKQDFSDTILANPNPQKDGLILEPQLTQVAQLEGFESEGRIYDANGISRTIKNGGGGGSKTGWYMVEEEQIINPLKGQTEFGWHFEQNVFSEESICRTLKSSEGSGNKPKIIQGYRIRRLSPLECFRLQGFPDSFEKVVSDTQLYKQAGNTISVTVIQAILKNLLK